MQERSTFDERCSVRWAVRRSACRARQEDLDLGFGLEDARDWGRLSRAGDLEGKILHTHLKGYRVAHLNSRRVTRVILTYRDGRAHRCAAHRLLRVCEGGQQEDELSGAPQPHHVALVPPRTSSARRLGRHSVSLLNPPKRGAAGKPARRARRERTRCRRDLHSSREINRAGGINKDGTRLAQHRAGGRPRAHNKQP